MQEPGSATHDLETSVEKRRKVGVFIDAQSLFTSALGVGAARLEYTKARPDYVEIVDQVEDYLSEEFGLEGYTISVCNVYTTSKGYPNALGKMLRATGIELKVLTGKKAYMNCKACGHWQSDDWDVGITADILFGLLAAKEFSSVILVSCDKVWGTFLLRLAGGGTWCRVFGYEGAMARRLHPFAVQLTDECIYDATASLMGFVRDKTGAQPAS